MLPTGVRHCTRAECAQLHFFGTTIPNNVVVTITNGETENVGTANGGAAYGPQWGSTLNIYGTLNWGFIVVPVQFDPTAQRSVINLYGNAFFGSTWPGNTLLLGDAWFVWQPYVTMNLYGNSVANYQYLGWGGHLNIYDHATNIVTVFVFDGGAASWFNPAMTGVNDTTRQINVAGGTLVLPGGDDGAVTNWIERGIFLVYGKSFDTNDISIVDRLTGTNVTYVTNADTSITTNTTLITNVFVTVPPLGTLQNISLASPRPSMMVGTIQNPIALGNFSGLSAVPLTGVDAAQSGPGTLQYHSSDTSVVTVSANGHVVAVSPGTATVSATFGSFTSTNSILITVTPLTNSLIHRYSFSESSGSTTADSVGGLAWNGTLNGGATLNGSGQVTLDGSSGFVQLPAGVVSGYDAVSIEAWVNFGTPAAFAALFAFGNQDASFSPLGENYIAFQPFTGVTPPTANVLFGLGDPGFANEQDATLPLVSGGVTNFLGNVYVAIVYHPYAGYVALYTNGVLAAINNNVSNPLASTLADDPLNFIGESLYGTDPFLNATVDEFRIYNGPLTSGEIAAGNILGPNQLVGTSRNVSLSARMSGSNLTIKWPMSSALDTLLSSPSLGAGATWTAVGGALTTDGSGNFQMTMPSGGAARFFRLAQ